MRYYKQIQDGYLLCIGTGNGGEEITQEEYDSLLAHIKARPIPEDGYDYRLKEDLTWELYELPPVDNDVEISDTEALNIILGGEGA